MTQTTKMTRLRALLFVPILLSLIACGQITLTPSDFGAKKDDPGFDNGPAFEKMCARAKELSDKGERVTIDLGKGAYHVWDKDLRKYELFISNHDHEKERPVAIFLDGVRGVTLRGDSTRLLFHGRLIPIVVRDCSEIVIEGISIDYPVPALTQIEISEIDGDRVWGEVLQETKWHITDGKFVLEGEGYEQIPNSAMPFTADGHMKAGRADIWFAPRQLTKEGPHRLLIEGWDETPNLSIGEIYVLRSGYRPTPGIVVIDSRVVTFRDVAVRYAEGMGLVAQNSDELTLEHFRVAREEGSPRFFTTQADATHFSGCRGFVSSVGGLYENMADDAINVHGTYLRVDSLSSAKTLSVTFAHPQSFGYTWYREGDEVRIVDRKTMQPLFVSTATGYVSHSPKEATVTLSEPLPKDLVEKWTKDSWVLENISAYPAVDFSLNVIRNNRARGALFSTAKKVLCYDNLFDHTHGSAILLNGDANGWFESGPCEDIEIYNNSFLNALTARYQFTEGVISVIPNIPNPIPGAGYHGKVTIRDNYFETFPSPLYYLESVREIVIRNNKIKTNNDYEPIFQNTGSVVIP